MKTSTIKHILHFLRAFMAFGGPAILFLISMMQGKGFPLKHGLFDSANYRFYAYILLCFIVAFLFHIGLILFQHNAIATHNEGEDDTVNPENR